jgi:hypothetical protein
MRTIPRRQELQAGPASLQAARKLHAQGIDILHGCWSRQPPDEPPPIPPKLPSLTDDELMDLFRLVNQWRKYLRLQLAMAEADESSAAAAARSAEAIALARAGGKTVAEMKARAREDASWAQAAAAHAAAYSYRKLVAALSENVDSDVFLLSRELTRRTSEPPLDRRTRRP